MYEFENQDQTQNRMTSDYDNESMREFLNNYGQDIDNPNYPMRCESSSDWS